MTRSSFTSLGLMLAMGGIAHAQTTSPTSPIKGGVATEGTQGAAGGSAPGAASVGTSSTGSATTGSTSTGGPGLVATPPIEAASLSDVRQAQSQNAPELTLEEVVLEALQNNPTPKAARAQLAASLARIGIARSGGRSNSQPGRFVQLFA